MEYAELIIKLIPAAAIKTKNLCNPSSNISKLERRNWRELETVAEIDPETMVVLDKFWTAIQKAVLTRLHQIQIEKLPTILFHFVYANLFKPKYYDIYKQTIPLLDQSVSRLSVKDIAVITYAFARTKLELDNLLFKFCDHLTKNKS